MSQYERVYCGICGGPMLNGASSSEDPHNWLRNAVLLTTAHSEGNTVVQDVYRLSTWHGSSLERPTLKAYPEGQLSLLRLAANTNRLGDFEIQSSKEHVRAFKIMRSSRELHSAFDESESMSVDVNVLADPEFWMEPPGPLYMAVHPNCLEIVDRLIGSIKTSAHMSQTIPADGVTSELQLWEVLHRRLESSTRYGTDCWQLEEPHSYFGGWSCRGLDWEPDNDPKWGALFEADPIDVPPYTEIILQNLKHTDEECLQNKTQTDIAASQDLHCESLLNQQTLPWLWDLDCDLVLRKQRESHRWDWGHLVRQLSCQEIIDPDNKSVQLPIHLRNRRRIWLLMEMARTTVDTQIVVRGTFTQNWYYVRKKASSSAPWLVVADWSIGDEASQDTH